MQEIQRGSTRSHYTENSIWKGLLTYPKTDQRMNKGTPVFITAYTKTRYLFLS